MRWDALTSWIFGWNALFPVAAPLPSPTLLHVTDVQCEAPNEGPLSAARLQEIISTCGTSRLEDLLPLLPSDLRSRRLLVYSSRSMQGATSLYPRVVLFGTEAKFIAAFAGDSAFAGGHSLETIEYLGPDRGYEFRNISFPSSGQGPATISEANPSSCLGCHGQTPRPNWEAYGGWPGVYGSRDDKKDAREASAYQAFADQVLGHSPRYAHFTDPKQYPMPEPDYDYIVQKGRSNLEFGIKVGLLSAQASSRELARAPELRPFRYALLYSILNTGGFTDDPLCPLDFGVPEQLAQVIPPEQSQRLSRSYADIFGEIEKMSKGNLERRQLLSCALLNDLPGTEPVTQANCTFKNIDGFLDQLIIKTRVRFIVEGLGISMAQWTMSLGRQDYVYASGPHLPFAGLDLYLWREFLSPADDPELYAVFERVWKERFTRDDYDGEMKFTPEERTATCQALAEKSLSALSTRAVVDLPEKDR